MSLYSPQSTAVVLNEPCWCLPADRAQVFMDPCVSFEYGAVLGSSHFLLNCDDKESMGIATGDLTESLCPASEEVFLYSLDGAFTRSLFSVEQRLSARFFR